MSKTGKSSSPTVKKPLANGFHPRAYHIYLERAGAPGNALDDWTRAERELQQESGKPGRKPGPKLVAA